jgi:predicted membrane protein
VRAPILEAKRVCNMVYFTVVTFTFGIAAIEVWHTELPVWAFVLALIICVSLDIPKYILTY